MILAKSDVELIAKIIWSQVFDRSCHWEARSTNNCGFFRSILPAHCKMKWLTSKMMAPGKLRIGYFGAKSCHIKTVDTHNSHTQNSHTYPNSHTFFVLRKVWLFGFGTDLPIIQIVTLTQIVTQTQIVRPFLVSRKCDYYDWLQYFL